MLKLPDSTKSFAHCQLDRKSLKIYFRLFSRDNIKTLVFQNHFWLKYFMRFSHSSSFLCAWTKNKSLDINFMTSVAPILLEFKESGCSVSTVFEESGFQ
jgi:hypothetical protein